MAHQVGHKATRAVFHPNTLMNGVATLNHKEFDIDECSSLGDLPVNPGRGDVGGNPGNINLEVPNGFKEVL